MDTRPLGIMEQTRQTSGSWAVAGGSRLWATHAALKLRISGAAASVTAALTILLILCGGQASAADGWGAAFPPLEPSARGMALGGSIAAIASGSEAMSWNPAGMLSLERREVSFTYSDLFGLDLVHHTVVHLAWPFMRHRVRWEDGEIRKEALPAPASRVVGLSVASLRCELDEGSYRETQFGLGLAWGVAAGIRGGTAIRIQTTQTGHAGAGGSGAALDVGVQRRWKGFRAGLSALNLVSLMNWENDPGAAVVHESNDPLPERWNSGLAWSIPGEMATLMVSGDWMRSSFRRVQYAAGLEVRPLEPLSLRAGWRNRQDAIGERREWSAGMGVSVAGLVIDYAWRESGRDLGDTHRWSASLGL